MKIIDISWPISKATTGYKDRSIVAIDELKNFNRDNARETAIHLSSHTGTHVDAPSHFLKEGITIDEMPLERLIGECVVLDMTSCAERITRDCLMEYNDKIIEGGIVLLRTINSDLSPTDKFNSHFIYLEASGALYLAEKKIKAVGIDYLGIEHSQPGHPTHENLMQADIAIIEGLRLGHVQAGNYFFVCLPLYSIGLEAAPARAILMIK
ncbi:MAG TPA: cyclase family protein [Candidatus Babeliales bacterium]|nr:cyclase family protein [Candidatus Babeliales bacterium]